MPSRSTSSRRSCRIPSAYNLAAQLRRAATSVPLNIAEGSGCSTDAEFARFVGYAYRSLKEVVTGLELCQRLYQSLPGPPATALIDEGNQISRMAHSFMQRLGTSTGSRAVVTLTAHGSSLKAGISRAQPLASTAFHNYGDVSAAEASRLAALLVGHMLPAFSLLAPCDPGASAPEYVTVIVECSTQDRAREPGIIPP